MEKEPKSNSDIKKSSTHIIKINSKNSRSSKIIKKNVRKKNPTIFQFIHSSSFIFEPRRAKIELTNVIDKNSIKPSSYELNLLQEHINKINLNNSDGNIISVLPFFSLVMDNVQKVDVKVDNKALLIQKLLIRIGKQVIYLSEKLLKNIIIYV